GDARWTGRNRQRHAAGLVSGPAAQGLAQQWRRSDSRRARAGARGGRMKRSTERILTTFAGSLVRPPEVLALTPESDVNARVDLPAHDVGDCCAQRACTSGVVAFGREGKDLRRALTSLATASSASPVG